MPNIKSAKKRWKQEIKKRELNSSERSKIRTFVKKTNKAVAESNKENAEELLTETYSILDKSVKKGIIHKNKAKRLKSKLGKRVHAIS